MKYKSFFFAMLLMLAAHCAMAQQEVYDRYVGRDDIDIVYVHGYRIDSLNKMDVILIRAKDSAGWEWIKEEFNIMPLSDNGKEALGRGIESIQVHLASRHDPTKPMETDMMENCEIKASFLRKEIVIVYYQNIKQWQLFHKQIFK